MAVDELKVWLDEYRCRSSRPDNCLEETSYRATRSDGRQVTVRGVHRWRDTAAVQGFLLPHFLLDYMRRLRDAGHEDFATWGGKLYDQVDFVVSDAVDRNGALVWENCAGIAQGMEQAEFADYFATVARVFRDHGDLRTAKGVMGHALRCLRALDTPVGVHTGGVCSGEFYCGSKRARFRPACWFHSRGRGIATNAVHTVLNQHLHVVRDMIRMYINVGRAVDLIDPSFGTPAEVLARIEDRAIAGLYQLAFSAGNNSIQRSRPPSIRQFMNYRKGIKVRPTQKHPDGNPLHYYWSFYEFDMKTGKGRNISHQNTCHYHTHTLNLMAAIRDSLDRYASTFTSTAEGWRMYEAVDALLEGAGEATGHPGSANAIYQFYRSEAAAFKSRRQNCSGGELLTDAALQVYSALYG